MKYFMLNTNKERDTYTLWNFKGGVYGNLNKVKGVILHDSASGMSGTAESVAKYTYNNCNANKNASNYHNVVDNNGNCFMLVPQEYATYSTGTQEGNHNYISIEIAPSLTGGDFKNDSERDTYKKAWLNACKLVADYLVYFGLSYNDIKQHRDFSNTACPYTMSKYFGSYEKALSETKNQVKKYMEEIKGSTTEDEPSKDNNITWKEADKMTSTPKGTGTRIKYVEVTGPYVEDINTFGHPKCNVNSAKSWFKEPKALKGWLVDSADGIVWLEVTSQKDINGKNFYLDLNEDGKKEFYYKTVVKEL